MAASGFVVLFMILAPVASARTSLTVTAPYVGMGTMPGNTWSQSSCGTAKIPVPAHFSRQVGVGGWVDRAGAGNCGKTVKGTGTDSSGYAVSDIALLYPFKIRSNGTYTVTLNATFRYSTDSGFTRGGSCPGQSNASASPFCLIADGAALYAYTYLYDTTDQSYYYGNFSTILANSAYYYVSCFNGTCATGSGSSGKSGLYSAATFFGSSMTDQLEKGHHYVLVAYFFGETYAELYGYPGASFPHSLAWASTNVGSHGNGITLNWITIS